MAVGVIVLTWTAVQMTVSIAIAEEKIVLRCAPFYTTKVSISDVVAVSMAPDTSLADGYGLRLVRAKTRGLIVGWPAITLETKNRRWIISTAQAEKVVRTMIKLRLSEQGCYSKKRKRRNHDESPP
ncbi:hypothetical protein [Arthrobacter sp. S2(2024)]|uniref:hypothetical protein n=1 Tax=Arthrobacter sp. S2(2024) TaxID=3111911 RepID=UPI002FC7A5DB